MTSPLRHRSTSPALLAILTAAALVGLPTLAVADPLSDLTGGVSDAAGDAVDDAADTVSDTVGGAGDTVSNAVGDVTDSVGNTTGGATDPVTGPVGDIVGGVTDTVDGVLDDATGVVDTVTDTVDEVVDETTDTVEQVVDDTTDAIDDTVEDVIEVVSPPAEGAPVPGTDAPQTGSDQGRSGRTDGPAGTDGPTAPETAVDPEPGSAAAEVVARPATAPGGAGTNPAARNRPTARRGASVEGNAAAAPALVPPTQPLASSVGWPSPADDLLNRAAEVGRRLTFPLLLALVVFGFISVQNRVDRKDPKLASAPLDADQEMLYFE